MHLTYVALHEVTWCMFVWRAQNTLRRQQFHVAPAMPALYVHHFSGYQKMRSEKILIHVESHASAVSLLKSGEQHYIKAISNNNSLCLSVLVTDTCREATEQKKYLHLLVCCGHWTLPFTRTICIGQPT